MGRTTGFAVRLVALATALVVGPAAIAPGTAEAPGVVARAGDGTTAARQYQWRTMQWDFAWEFGESLGSPPYRGADINGGKWIDHSNGTGRVAKSGGGMEFRSGRYSARVPYADHGDTWVTLEGKPARLGRWELRARSDVLEKQFADYRFVIELIPEDPAGYDCGAHNLTIARITPGTGASVSIGVNAGTAAWTKTLSGYDRPDGAYAVQVTNRAITWFVDGKAVAALLSSAAIPQVPMTVRMRLEGKGATEMNDTAVKLDWVRHYDLNKGKRAATGTRLDKGTYTPPADCTR